MSAFAQEVLIGRAAPRVGARYETAAGDVCEVKARTGELTVVRWEGKRPGEGRCIFHTLAEFRACLRPHVAPFDPARAVVDRRVPD